MLSTDRVRFKSSFFSTPGLALRRLTHFWVQPRSPSRSSSRSARERGEQLEQLQARLDYSFKDLSLLDHALTHRSFAHESGSPGADYEALEFLGDSVLGLAISEHLFRADPNRLEGELSKLKGLLVSKPELAELSSRLDLGSFLRLSHGEEKTGGRKKKAILADAFESVAGAIYLDGGFEPARKFILDQFRDHLRRVARRKLELRDFKSALQEQLHSQGLPGPNYRVVKETGPNHRKVFLVEVRSKTRLLGQASGRAKKEAEQNAAQIALGELARDSGS